MRQRNVKNLQGRIEENSTHLIREPKAMKGRWKEVFGNDFPIRLEIPSIWRWEAARDSSF